MTDSELFGIIGAGAWIPQIINWARSYLAKPKISVMAAPAVELTFNHLGPMLNLNLVIASAQKDAIVTEIAIDLIHEKGESHILKWKWLRDLQFQIEGIPDIAAQFNKSHAALAIKVPVASLAEQQVRFEEPEFTVWMEQVQSALFEEYTYLKSKGPNGIEQLKFSRQFKDAQDQFNDRMYFKEGSYRCDIHIFELTQKSPFTSEFEFLLSRPDVERLRTNASFFDTFVTQWIGANEGIKAQWPLWNWIHPKLSTNKSSLRVLSR